jgi:hypothetical protein
MYVEIVSLLEYGHACFSKMNMDCLDLSVDLSCQVLLEIARNSVTFQMPVEI